jgi:hypothetical protein
MRRGISNGDWKTVAGDHYIDALPTSFNEHSIFSSIILHLYIIKYSVQLYSKFFVFSIETLPLLHTLTHTHTHIHTQLYGILSFSLSLTDPHRVYQNNQNTILYIITLSLSHTPTHPPTHIYRVS